MNFSGELPLFPRKTTGAKARGVLSDADGVSDGYDCCGYTGHWWSGITLVLA